MKNILTIVMLLLISNQICFAESDAYKAYLAKHAASANENNMTALLDQNATPNESEIDPSAVVDSNSTKVMAPKSSKKIGAISTINGGGVAGAAIGAALLGVTFLYNSLVE